MERVFQAIRAQATSGTRYLRYLRGTVDLGLLYKRGICSFNFTGYSDANWAGDTIDRKSTSGIVFTINNTPVAWTSNKQNIVALSTAESELIGLVNSAKEYIWFRKFFSELNFEFSNPTIIYGDNNAANSIVKNNLSNCRSKHIGIKYSFIKEQIEQKTFTIIKCATSENLADIFTKALPREIFVKIRDKFNLTQ